MLGSKCYLSQFYKPTLTKIYSTSPEYQRARQAKMWSNPPQINIPLVDRPDLANVKIGNPYQSTAQMVENVNREVIMGPKFEMVNETDSTKVMNNVNVVPQNLSVVKVTPNINVVPQDQLLITPQNQLRTTNIRTNNRINVTVNQDQF